MISSDGRGRVLTGVSPLHGFHVTAPIGCDALNAQPVARQEYHYHSHAVIAYKLPVLVFLLSVLSLGFPHRGKCHGAPVVWLCMEIESIRFALYCAALQAEYGKLQEQKEALYVDYGKLKKQVKEYGVIKQNIDSILWLNREPEWEKEAEL